MNNNQTNIDPLPSSTFLLVYYETILILTFLTFNHYPYFSIIAHHCIYNAQPNDLCLEA